jgi:hypothetical protein
LQNSFLFKSQGISIDQEWNIESEQHDWLGFHNEETEVNNHENLTVKEDSVNINTANDADECLSDHSNSEEWTEDPNFENRLTGNSDTLLHPFDIRTLCKTMSFSPAEGQSPLGLYQDKYAEILSFPTIYCGQMRPENKDREIPVHYSSICKWELRCIDRRAACSIPNIFFKLKKIQVKQIHDKVSLAMRKCQTEGRKVTVGNVLNPGEFDNIVRLNEGFRVLRKLRGSPSYWENAKKDLFGMIRQLGIPTWFCSLSAAESRWIDLLKTLGKLVKNLDYTDEDVRNLSWTERCELIQADPVTCTRYFNHRIQIFISDVFKSPLAPLGNVLDYFYRVEFQQRGSPHINLLVCIENAPKYERNSNQEVADFVHEHCTCEKNDDISDLINYQTHRHARTCREKGKNMCRFNFPLPPMSSTQILEPLGELEKENYPNVGKTIYAFIHT